VPSATDAPATAEKEHVLALVRRYGWNATSYQVLEPGYRYFFPDDDAVVAFVDTGQAWVAAGAPLADERRLVEVATAFVAAARAARRRACFFATEERFAGQAPFPTLLIGEQAVWDPGKWEGTLAASASLREQLRRARAKGVRIRALEAVEAAVPETRTRAAIEAVVGRWLGARELPPMGFLARVEPLAALPDQRLFLAEIRDEAPTEIRDETATEIRDETAVGRALVGVLSVVPIHGRDGWLLQNLLRAPGAPNGTAEALVDAAMREAQARGLTFLTLGLAPLAGDVPPPLRLARRAGRRLYNFAGLHAFKAKLRPARWDAMFLCYPSDGSATRAVVDVLSAFARGGLLRYGLRALARGPAIAVTILLALLVPWTAMLAAADAGRWFPRPWVKWAWVVFDLLLIVGLSLLERRWRQWLVRLLAIAIAADAAVTAIEALAWNVPRAHGVLDALLVAVAIAGPTLAAFVLWGAAGRERSPRAAR
jgi:phosphatidylglycerol lysyltransferase